MISPTRSQIRPARREVMLSPQPRQLDIAELLTDMGLYAAAQHAV
jgi:hypothetical protein